MKKRKLLGLALLLFSWSSQGQSTLNSTGGSKVISDNIHSYSIGEMTLVHTAENANLVVTHGVLQPFQSEVSISDIQLNPHELRLYPNPTDDILYLEANLPGPGDLNVVLYDISGRELLRKNWHLVTGKEKNSLSLQAFASGNYLLKAQVKQGENTASQSFKIQKIQ